MAGSHYEGRATSNSGCRMSVPVRIKIAVPLEGLGSRLDPLRKRKNLALFSLHLAAGDARITAPRFCGLTHVMGAGVIPG